MGRLSQPLGKKAAQPARASGGAGAPSMTDRDYTVPSKWEAKCPPYHLGAGLFPHADYVS